MKFFTLSFIIFSVSFGAEQAILDNDQDGIPSAIELHFGLSDHDSSDALNDLDGDGIDNRTEFLAGSNMGLLDRVHGRINEEIWYDIGDAYVDDFTIYEASRRVPSQIGSLAETVVAEEKTPADYFIRRIRGFISPKISGEYTFWATGDDDCRFLLSTTESKFDKQIVIDTSTFGPKADYDHDPSMKSRKIQLVAGQKYYFELWNSEGIGGSHVYLAWQPPGGKRETISSEYLTSYDKKNQLDCDDDDLLDQYESANGLNPKDAGRSKESPDGWFGDLDQDGLFNGDEQELGTRANFADSDGDGVDDSIEHLDLKTDPLKKDTEPLASVGHWRGTEFTANTGSWERGGDGVATCQSQLGTVTFSLNASTKNCHAIKFIIKRPNEHIRGPFSVRIYFNQKLIQTRGFRFDQHNQQTIMAWLPRLPEKEKCEVSIGGISRRSSESFQLQSVELLSAVGDDHDQNKLPDWVETIYRERNKFDQSQVLSRTSPATIEGNSQWFDFVNGHGAAVQPAPNGRFYSEIELSPTLPKSLNFAFANGMLSSRCDVMWMPTNLFQDSLPVIRQDDSLLLTYADDESSRRVTIIANGNTYQSDSDKPCVVKFSQAGDIPLLCTTTDESGKQIETRYVVKVLPRMNLGDAFLITGVKREWMPAGISDDISLHFDHRVDATPLESSSGFSILSYHTAETSVIARCGKNGPILGAGTLNGVTIYRTNCDFEKSTEAGRVYNIIHQIIGEVHDEEIRFQLLGNDVTFIDGKRTNSLFAKDINHLGQLKLQMLAGPKSTIFGFTISIWKNGVKIAEVF